MKSTKRILSAILALCMVFGCFAVGFTAQASSADLQKQIDDAIAAGIDVDWKGGNITVDKTIVIDGNVTVNLNNATLTGAEGISVVNVKGGNVTLYNGTFIANSKSYSGETGFIKSLMNYRPAVSINGGNVVLDCITAVGSLIRIPNSGTIEVTSGNGINANAGSVTIRDSIAVGMKALDNTKATVVIEDALLVGIYKAINDVKKVTYAEGYNQYRSVHFLEDLLADGVTLTDGEYDYFDALTNSQGNLSAGSVIASVKAPEFADLQSEYAGGTLTITAAADAENEKADVPNRYSYKYTPVSATIEGNEVAFDEEDGAYTAQFAAEADNEYEVTAAYKLSVKLGQKQKEVLVGALDTVAKYADKAPELLYRFVKDFEKLYDQAMVYVTTFYNAKNDDLTKDYFSGKDMNKLYGLVLALVGENYTGLEDGSMVSVSRTEKWLESPIFARKYNSGDTVGAYEFAARYDAADYFGVFDGSLYYKKNADGSGVGIIEQFKKYYDDVIDLVYAGSTTEFADAPAAAEYVGNNWEDMLELVEAAVVVVEEAHALINDETVAGNLGSILNMNSIDSYIEMFNKAYGYLDKVTSRIDDVKNSSFAAKYGDKAGYYCKLYTKKALDIVNNPSRYFAIDVDGNYVNLFDFKQVQTVKTDSDKKVRVEVTVSGAGSAALNGNSFTAYYVEYFNIGEEVKVVPVAENFHYMTVETNGKGSVVDGSEYVAKAATNLEIKVVFTAENNVGTDLAEVVFMTGKALGYKYLDKVEATSDMVDDSIFDNITIPSFKGMEFSAWSMTADEIAEAIDGGASVVLVYADYDYEETVQVPVQSEAIKMTQEDSVVVEGGKAYFEASIQVPDGYTAIEAGIIATKNTAYSTNDTLTVDLSGTKGVVFGRVDAKDSYGNVQKNVLYTLGIKTTGTVYARGYIVLVDAAGNAEVVYTDVVNATV